MRLDDDETTPPPRSGEPAGEFGHFHARGTVSTAEGRVGFVMDAWGAGPFKLIHEGRTWLFEDSDRFGPSLVNRRGDILDKQPGDRSPFWRLHGLWSSQGRQVNGDQCVFRFEPERPNYYSKIGRRNVLFHCGDVDGPYYCVDPHKRIGE